MESANGKTVLISGASIAGLATAYWLSQLGYRVAVVERAPAPRTGGAAINVQGEALASAKRMGIFAQLKANRLQLKRLEFKDADDVTQGSLEMQPADAPLADDDIDDIEIERDKLVAILLGVLPSDVEFLFNNHLTALRETPDALHATFRQGAPRVFDLVLGCDGLHSGVRQLWFGPAAEYVQSLGYYFSLTVVRHLLLAPNTAQLYNVPGKGIILNAYNGKTDIIFWFSAEAALAAAPREAAQQRQLVAAQFAGQGWRTAELLAEVQRADISYFDTFCQVKMPSWTKGRMALVGDAGYCASPAAGIGASLAMRGAAAVAAALATHDGHFEQAFQAYNHALRPFIDEVQATALTMLRDYFVPPTEEAIRTRNTQGIPF